MNGNKPMTSEISSSEDKPFETLTSLADFGWNSHFAGVYAAANEPELAPAKVVEVHRGHIRIVAPSLDKLIQTFTADLSGEDTVPTVGDWILYDPETEQGKLLLERSSLFRRRAPGTDRRYQLIAANIDTLFIVSSCNQDFNLARLERYLALATDAGVMPVLVLTKADLADDPRAYAADAASLMAGLMVELVDARDAESVQCLQDWCKPGQSAALVGSSGVGKSTLVNTLTGGRDILTQGIREDDAKGRHTTTARTFYRLASGGWLLDTPGMRGLEVTDAADGLDDVFSDITSLAGGCKFGDCAHDTEPGCAVRAAIKRGELDPDRLKRWHKLAAEEAHASATMAERHSRDKAFGRLIKQTQKDKKRFRRG